MKRGLVGGRVRELRDHLDWSQDELCARLRDCGYPVLQPNLSLMEQGKRKIDADAVPCFAKVLGVDPNELYGFGSVDKPTPPASFDGTSGQTGYVPTVGDELGADLLDIMRGVSPKQAQLLLGMLRVIDEAGIE